MDSQKANPHQSSLRQDLFELLLKLSILIVVGCFSFIFIFGVVIAPDDSMSPAVNPGDIAVYYRLGKTYAVDDVVVVSINKEKQIRRIMAAPGDVVEIRDKGLYVNGNLHVVADKEILPYVKGPKYPLKLGPNQYFVMGDYVTGVSDSRKYGVVDQSQLLGRLTVLIRGKRF